MKTRLQIIINFILTIISLILIFNEYIFLGIGIMFFNFAIIQLIRKIYKKG